jgi:hypothetical protein
MDFPAVPDAPQHGATNLPPNRLEGNALETIAAMVEPED